MYCIIIFLAAGPGNDQVLSPRKNCVLATAASAERPVADKARFIVPVVVIGPPVAVINLEDSVDIDVIVPSPSEASIVLTTSLTL